MSSPSVVDLTVTASGFDLSSIKVAPASVIKDYSLKNQVQGFKARDPIAEKKLADDILADAMANGSYGFAAPIEGIYAEASHVTRVMTFKDMDPRLHTIFAENLDKATLAAVAERGGIVKTRFWIKLTDTIFTGVTDPADPSKKADLQLFFSYAKLAGPEVHNKIMISHSERIYGMMASGFETYITKYLNSKGIIWNTFGNGVSGEHLATPKSIYCSGFPQSKENRDIHNKEMSIIFAGMDNNDEGKGPCPEITFLGKPRPGTVTSTFGQA